MLAVPAARGVRHPAGGGMAHFRALDRTRPMGVGGGACGGLLRPAFVPGVGVGRIQRPVSLRIGVWSA